LDFTWLKQTRRAVAVVFPDFLTSFEQEAKGYTAFAGAARQKEVQTMPGFLQVNRRRLASLRAGVDFSLFESLNIGGLYRSNMNAHSHNGLPCFVV
jgi:hypothetical protein